MVNLEYRQSQPSLPSPRPPLMSRPTSHSSSSVLQTPTHSSNPNEQPYQPITSPQGSQAYPPFPDPSIRPSLLILILGGAWRSSGSRLRLVLVVAIALVVVVVIIVVNHIVQNPSKPTMTWVYLYSLTSLTGANALSTPPSEAKPYDS